MVCCGISALSPFNHDYAIEYLPFCSPLSAVRICTVYTGCHFTAHDVSISCLLFFLPFLSLCLPADADVHRSVCSHKFWRRSSHFHCFGDSRSLCILVPIRFTVCAPVRLMFANPLSLAFCVVPLRTSTISCQAAATVSRMSMTWTTSSTRSML